MRQHALAMALLARRRVPMTTRAPSVASEVSFILVVAVVGKGEGEPRVSS